LTADRFDLVSSSCLKTGQRSRDRDRRSDEFDRATGIGNDHSLNNDLAARDNSQA
jgi:hypothetical protein